MVEAVAVGEGKSNWRWRRQKHSPKRTMEEDAMEE